MHKGWDRKMLGTQIGKHDSRPLRETTRSDFFLGRWMPNAKLPERGSVMIMAESSSLDLYRAVSVEGEKIELVPMNGDRSMLTGNIDVLILDCGFEAKAGLRLLKEIKAARPDIPVIFLAEGDPEGIEADSLRCGARFFLAKPINIFDLVQLMQRLLDLKRASREKRAPVMAAEGDKAETLELATTDKPVNILRVIQFIEENITEKLTLDALSREANLSKFHFCRFFYKYTGMSPMRFVAHLRVEKAKEYLKRDNSTVSEVTFQVGFSDIGTFIRQFKKFTGMTPSLFQDATRRSRLTEAETV
jgi:AraC family transcriptional regulator